MPKEKMSAAPVAQGLTDEQIMQAMESAGVKFRAVYQPRLKADKVMACGSIDATKIVAGVRAALAVTEPLQGAQEPRCKDCGCKTTDPWIDHRGCEQATPAPTQGTQEPVAWIPVSDRLPEYEESVLLYRPHSYRTNDPIFLISHRISGYEGPHEFRCVAEPTHWTPLRSPAAPAPVGCDLTPRKSGDGA